MTSLRQVASFDPQIRHDLLLPSTPAIVDEEEPDSGEEGVDLDDNTRPQMLILDTVMWREQLEQELRRRARPFASLSWPLDFSRLPQIDVFVGNLLGVTDYSTRMERLVDITNAFFASVGPLLPEIVGATTRYTILLTGNLQALALIEKTTVYSTKLLQIELIDKNVNLPRALIYERNPRTGLFTITHSDTNPARRLLNANTSYVFLQSLIDHYNITDAPPQTEPDLFDAIQELKIKSVLADSDAMARLLQLYYFAPGLLGFIEQLVITAAAISRTSLVGDRQTARISNDAAGLADFAPSGWDTGDIFAILLALSSEFRLRADPTLASDDNDGDSRRSQPIEPKRRRIEAVMLTDAAIGRLQVLLATSASTQTSPPTLAPAPAAPGQIVQI